MLQDIWFYAFVITSLILGWVWGRFRSKFMPLYEIIAGLRLERDAQARTIEWQRKVIRDLENQKESLEKASIRGFRGAFGEGKDQ